MFCHLCLQARKSQSQEVKESEGPPPKKPESKKFPLQKAKKEVEEAGRWKKWKLKVEILR